MVRFVAPVPALCDPGLRERQDLGPPDRHGAGEAVQLGQAAVGAPAVVPVEAVGDVVALSAGPDGREQRPELLPTCDTLVTRTRTRKTPAAASRAVSVTTRVSCAGSR